MRRDLSDTSDRQEHQGLTSNQNEKHDRRTSWSAGEKTRIKSSKHRLYFSKVESIYITQKYLFADI